MGLTRRRGEVGPAGRRGRRAHRPSGIGREGRRLDFRERYRAPGYDAWAADFEARLAAGLVLPPPSAEAFPAPRTLTAQELHLSLTEPAAVAATLAGTLVQQLRRKRKPDPPA